MIQNNTDFFGILWHPHQGLWNNTLVVATRRMFPIASINKKIYALLVHLDTFILFLRTLARRIYLLGITSIFVKVKVPHDFSVLYIDLGTHKEGNELSLVVEEILPKVCDKFEAYGFEANHQSFEQVREKFSDKENVQIIHQALCHELPRNGKIKLYKDTSNGLGDSIYRQTKSYEEVEAMRLSDFLRENDLLKHQIILLRMNIEGAEYDVLQDLVKSGLANRIDGYFGMWDDVSKIDMERDNQFRDFLSQNGIYTFPFNGRDMKWSLRKKCIAHNIQTDILKALSTKSK